MKKVLVMIVISLIILLCVLVVTFNILPSKLETIRKEKYINYLNSILPDINSNEIKVVQNREENLKIVQAIKTYYTACKTENYYQVKDILNKEYVKYMNLNITDVMVNNSLKNIELLDTSNVYDIGNNMYFGVVENDKNKQNVILTGIMLNEDKTKYSIFFDGMYNGDDVKKVNKVFETEDFHNIENSEQ